MQLRVLSASIECNGGSHPLVLWHQSEDRRLEGTKNMFKHNLLQEFISYSVYCCRSSKAGLPPVVPAMIGENDTGTNDR